MTLTKEELTELTRLINARLAEFSLPAMPTLTDGIVRVAHDVMMEWVEGQAATPPTTGNQENDHAEALTIAYGVGYERGKEAASRELLGDKAVDSSPRLVTNSAPEPDDEDGFDRLTTSGDTKPDHPDAKWRDLMRDMDEAMAAPKPATLPTPAQARENVAALLAQANGEHGFDLTPGYKRKPEAAKGRRGNVLPSREQVVAFLQEIAMDGVAPSQASFNLSKPAGWGTATAHTQRLGVSWSELVAQAGLVEKPRGRTV